MSKHQHAPGERNTIAARIRVTINFCRPHLEENNFFGCDHQPPIFQDLPYDWRTVDLDLNTEISFSTFQILWRKVLDFVFQKRTQPQQVPACPVSAALWLLAAASRRHSDHNMAAKTSQAEDFLVKEFEQWQKDTSSEAIFLLEVCKKLLVQSWS